MTIFLHIGTAKTGTTTIQHAMYSNRDYLRESHSLNYPHFEPNSWALMVPFTSVEKYLPLQRHILRRLGSLEDYISLGQRFKDWLEKESGKFRAHVLSSEQLLGADNDSLSGLHRFLTSLGHDVKVVVYVRHPVDRLSSHMSQWMRSGLGEASAFPLEDNITPAIKQYSEMFGRENMIVRRFGERYFTDNDLMRDFTKIVSGAPIDMRVERLNESLSVAAVYLAQCGFSVAPLSSGRRAFDRQLPSIPGPKFLAPRGMAEKVMSEYEVGLAYLEREFGLVFDPVDTSRLPETLEMNFPPEAIRRVAEIINDQALEIERLKAAPTGTSTPWSWFRRFF